MDDGIVFHRAANNVIVSEGIDGVIGAQYFCFIHKLHRDHMKRSVIWERRGWVDRPMDTMQGNYPTTVSEPNQDEAMDGDQSMYTAQSGGLMQTPLSDFEDHWPMTPVLSDIAGLNPFSADSYSERPGVTMTQEEMSPESCVSRLAGMSLIKEEEKSFSPFDKARLTDEESHKPPPSKATKREAKTKEEEAEPIFATSKLSNRFGSRPPYIPPIQPAGVSTNPPSKELSSSPKESAHLPRSPSLFKQPPACVTQVREGQQSESSKKPDELPAPSGKNDEFSAATSGDGSGVVTGMGSYPDRDASVATYKWWQHPETEPTNEQEALFREKWSRNMCPACMFLKGHSDHCNLDEWETRQEKIPVAPTVKSEHPTPKSKSVSAGPAISLDGTPASSANGSPMHGSVGDIAKPSSRGNLSLLLTNLEDESRRKAGSKKSTPRGRTSVSVSPREGSKPSPPVFGGGRRVETLRRSRVRRMLHRRRPKDPVNEAIDQAVSGMDLKSQVHRGSTNHQHRQDLHPLHKRSIRPLYRVTHITDRHYAISEKVTPIEYNTTARGGLSKEDLSQCVPRCQRCVKRISQNRRNTEVDLPLNRWRNVGRRSVNTASVSTRQDKP